MQLNLRKSTLLLRIIGSISLIIFITIQVAEINNINAIYFLYSSVLCFLIILISKFLIYLGKYYYKE
ncbi:hypothetical protein BC952_2593 [Flavobacterium limicola]|jgi:hypothetical protein|uniref:Uncharacterized protein n=1 Tax=Flavobacterium limicola TaxID=180441 RepID=A0A495RZD2_9FLAO|nr:hypothetical protein BC952_2593 [Flavobacterium limicola]